MLSRNAFIVVALLVAVACPALSQGVPESISYQGKLTDSAGQPVSGAHAIQFKLWNTETGGTTPLWDSGPLDVQISDGLFTVALGTGTNPIDSSKLANGEVWMEVTVESDPPLSRVKLSSSPFALRAEALSLPYLGSTGEPGTAFRIDSTGSGDAVRGSASGTGRAGYFDITNAGSSAPALYATTTGTGPAAKLEGKVEITGDLKAPIFYDINDINYYVNPANTTKLGTLWTAGDVGIRTSSPATALDVAGPMRAGGYPKGALPSPGVAGRFVRVTDNVRGLWMDSGSQWFPITGRSVNVMAFGAKPDGGVTDNVAAFTAAAAAAGPGGEVYIPAADNFYGLASAWVIDSLRGIHIRGDGERSFLVATGPSNVITVLGCDYYKISDLGIGGVVGSQNGIEIGDRVGAAPSMRGTIQNVYIQSVDGNCIQISRGIATTIINPIMPAQNGMNPPPINIPNMGTSKNGIYVLGSGWNNALTIIGPVIEGKMDHGIDVESPVEGVYIYGGTIEGNGEDPTDANIRMQGKYLLVSGTYMEATGTYARNLITGARHTLIDTVIAGGTDPAGAIEFIGCVQGELRNSSVNTVTIDSACTGVRIVNVDYGNSGGGLIDNGVGTQIEKVSNSSNENQQAAGKKLDSHVNFARNGGFERWVSSTSLDAAFAGGFTNFAGSSHQRTGDGQADTTKLQGHYAVKVTPGGSPGATGLVYQGPKPTYETNLDKTITVSVCARVASGTQTFSIQIWYDGGASVNPQSFTADATWRKFSASFPVKAGYSGYDVRFFPGASSPMYFDAFSLTLGTSGPYGEFDNLKATEPEPTGHTNVSFSSAPTFYHSAATFQSILLAGNVTSVTLSDGIIGQPLWIKFTQDGNGGRTVAGWPANVRWAGGAAPTITTGANKSDVFGLMYDGTNWWDIGIRQNE